MTATEARAPSGLMTLLRIIGGAVRGVGAAVRRVASARGKTDMPAPPVSEARALPPAGSRKARYVVARSSRPRAEARHGGSGETRPVDRQAASPDAADSLDARALLDALMGFAAQCQAETEAQARDIFPERDDEGLAVLWARLGVMVLSRKQRAALALYLKEYEIKLALFAQEFPVRLALYAAGVTARGRRWRCLTARLTLLSRLSQKCDKWPVWGPGWNCAIFVTISQ